MMKPMRRSDCQTSQEEAYRLLEKSNFITISMINEDGSPYCVVVDFILDDGKIYFHGANEGQKLDCIRNDPRVCVSAVAAGKSVPELLTTKYASVIVHGKAHEITDSTKKEDIIKKIAKRIGAGEAEKEKFKTTFDSFFGGMSVVCIDIEEITGKHSV